MVGRWNQACLASLGQTWPQGSSFGMSLFNHSSVQDSATAAWRRWITTWVASTCHHPGLQLIQCRQPQLQSSHLHPPPPQAPWLCEGH